MHAYDLNLREYVMYAIEGTALYVLIYYILANASCAACSETTQQTSAVQLCIHMIVTSTPREAWIVIIRHMRHDSIYMPHEA